MTILPTSKTWRFSVLVLIPFVAIAGLSCVALAIVLGQAVLRADTIALERQAMHVRHAISERIAQLPHDQESVAIWDDAILKLRERDARWFDENLGTWMHDYFAHDQAFVADSSGLVVYAMSAGEIITGVEAPATRELVAELAAALQDPATASASHPGAPHITDLMTVDGRPAVVSAMLIVPHTEEFETLPGEGYVHVSVQFLDGSFVDGIADRLLLEGARFVRVGEADPGMSSVAIRNSRGEAIGELQWLPDEPGTKILAAVLPAVAVIALVLAILFGMLLRRLYRSSVALETSRAQAQHLAFHDSLTGLPNRHLLVDRLDAVEGRRSEARARCALLLLDLDRFKDVNDTYGHHAGDELIREFGHRLKALVAPRDTLARLGGDEFAIIVSTVADFGDLERYCDSILRAVVAPFAVTGGRASVGVSIGAAPIGPETDRHEILRRADIALYAAKRGGRNTYRVFEPDMDEHLKLQHYIEQELRKSVGAGVGLDVCYQPKVSGRTGIVTGLEALVRWTHPELGQVAPSVFVPVAIECGLIPRLDEWVLRRAAAAARDWPHVTIAVNVTPDAFRSPGMAARTLAVLAETGFDPARLEIEITETVIVEVSDVTVSEIAALRRAGIRIALDDFGTGYSSLNHLRRLNVDRIKIDRSFVHHLGQTADSTVIVSAVVKLGHTMGVAVTAEGVETEAQRDFLRTIGCDEMQGYLFSEPVPADRVPVLLEATVRDLAV